jgi:eukaryotic-like serine/threonine-protein kinase
MLAPVRATTLPVPYHVPDALRDQLQASLGTAYTLEREIGGGGMSRVFVAREEALGRDVVVKVLTPELAQGVSAERFAREVRLAAALQEPHIVPVHSAGVMADGLPYYTMPYVRGESLRVRLARGPVPLTEAVAILRDVATALEYAHGRGIVHRDIKPENVLLSGRTAVVADFGIAKALEASRTRAPDGPAAPMEGLTQFGTSLGTPAYMAPEQAAADPATDHRADLYAWAVMAYELLAGRHPFADKTSPQALMAAHFSEIPAPLPKTLPRPLAALVARCLAKDPAERPASAAEVLNALEGRGGSVPPTTSPRRSRWPIAVALLAIVAVSAIGIVAARRGSEATLPADHAARAVTATELAIPDIATDPSIAVLPLVNLSGDKEQQFFSDGISEELLNLLSKVPQIRVIARTSSFSFRDRKTPIQDMARRLHVAAILDGSVQHVGDRVRINVELVRASDQSEIFSERYDRTIDDIFKVQDEIAAAVVQQLRVKLLSAVPKARRIDPKAYELILEGRFLILQGNKDSRRRAIELLKKAIAVDPLAAKAWTSLVSAYISQAASGEVPVGEGQRLAREAANRALALDPDDAVTLSLLGWMTMTYDSDMRSAGQYFERALAKDPRNITVLGNAALFVQNLGRLDQSIAVQEYQQAHDPANPRVPLNLSTTYYFARRWDDAERAARTVLDLSPGRTGIRSSLALVLLQKGEGENALREAMAEPSEEYRLPAVAIVSHALGRNAVADSALALFVSRFGSDDPFAIATVYAHRGENDKAFAWLDRAAAAKAIAYVIVDPLFAPLRRDPRWMPFLQRNGMSPAQLAAIDFKLEIPK